MPIRNFHFSQLASLPLEGVGIHASFSLSLILKEHDEKHGKKIYLSAHGNSNAAKANGSGKLLFWCSVINNIDQRKYILNNETGDSFAAGLDDIIIGSTDFFMKANKYITPTITIEGGYILSDYTGQIIPFPGSLKKTIKLQSFTG
ncbi:hypothetical protein [Dryocola clanedunensis]|uniref:hypothetical protein n=1 Tax=Cedecea sulfonylureivorans TaxID=3051154 RepID=UPI001F24EB5C|nr:hypothetical protein [Cedecea sulfonylureivorans]